MKHYNVKEIQNNVVNSLVDEEFLRHYRVDEIAASMGYSGPYTGNYGYDYFMGGGKFRIFKKNSVMYCMCLV